VVQRLLRILEDHFRPPREVLVSPVDVILTDNDIVQPDIVVVAHTDQVSARGIEGAPLIVVEVLSPATAQYDRTTKAQRYAALAVLHYWLADPLSEQMECYRLAEGPYQLVVTGGTESAVSHPDFPGLHIPGPALWR